MTLPPGKLPPSKHKRGIEAWTVDGDGREVVILNPSQSVQRWPGVYGDSGEFNKLEPWAKYYEQAIAFLVSAKVLSEDAGKKGAAGGKVTWTQGAVCYSNLNTATELFLKACIWVHSGNQPKKIHKIDQLYAEYRRLLPQAEFHFSIKLAWLNPAMFNNSIDRKPDQLYKYHIGDDGKTSEGIHIFHPDLVFDRVNELERIWPNAWRILTSSEIPSSEGHCVIDLATLLLSAESP